jgi:hypothetical protein
VINYVCKDLIARRGARSLSEVAASKTARLTNVMIGLFNSFTQTYALVADSYRSRLRSFCVRGLNKLGAEQRFACRMPGWHCCRYREVEDNLVVWPGSLEADGSVPKDSQGLCNPGQYLKDDAKDGKTVATCRLCDPGFYQEPGAENILDSCSPCEKGAMAFRTSRTI